jgi:hypothetical protein
MSISDIENEFKRLEQIRTNNNWFDPRNLDNYTLKTRSYTFGDRNYFTISEDRYHLYKDLQASRGIPDLLDTTINEYLVDFENTSYDLNFEDYERVDEVKEYLCVDELDCFVELGFRTPKLLNFWSENNLYVKGYDVVKVNVLVSSELGWDVCEYDLSFPNKELQRVYSDMKENSFFHIEVPIEIQSTPNVKYGHMQTFFPNDLKCMLESIGFDIVFKSSREDVERILVSK